jgi:cell division protein FtsB
MHWLNRILLALLVAAAVAWGPEQFELAASGNDLERVEAEAAELRATNRQLEEEIELLEAEVRALSRDPAEVARIARQDLNLVMPGEVVFEVQRPVSKAKKAPSSRKAAPPGRTP